MKIKRLMSKDVVKVNSNESIFTAIKKMHNHNVGFIVVCDNDELKGVFTDRDALMSLIANIKLEDPVSKIMRKDVITAKTAMSNIEAAELMGYYQIKRLVILDDFGKIAGVLSLSDLANSIESEELALEALCEISAGFDNFDDFILNHDNNLDDDEIDDL